MISHFKKIYHDYISGRLKSDDIAILREGIETTPDDQLWDIMLESESLPDRVSVSHIPDTTRLRISRNLRRTALRSRLIALSRYAAALILAGTVAAVILLGLNRPADNRDLTALVAPGNRTELILPDGSKVKLNSVSELSYDCNDRSRRVVRLSGEAYFDVAKDADRPFIVEIGDMNIEVHGTSFNVNAYNLQRVETALVSGSVTITGEALKGRSYKLRPGEKAVFNANNGAISISDSDMALATGWTRGRLVFEDEPLAEVIKRIERWYGVDIELKRSGVSGDLLTGAFHREDITDVLASLSAAYNFRYTINKNHITIY